jgi:hypothetical protein
MVPIQNKPFMELMGSVRSGCFGRHRETSCEEEEEKGLKDNEITNKIPTKNT